MKAVSDCHTCTAFCFTPGEGSGARDHVVQPLLRLPATRIVAERMRRVRNESCAVSSAGSRRRCVSFRLLICHAFQADDPLPDRRMRDKDIGQEPFLLSQG
jgi:hypothetical protein